MVVNLFGRIVAREISTAPADSQVSVELDHETRDGSRWLRSMRFVCFAGAPAEVRISDVPANELFGGLRLKRRVTSCAGASRRVICAWWTLNEQRRDFGWE
jgi:hypothetical protein